LIFKWWKQRRRRIILAAPAPRDLDAVLAAAVPWYVGWNDSMRRKLSDNTRIFITEKDWEGCDGLEITEEMQIVISAQAAMMLSGIEDYCFEGVRTVLVYPASFRRETQSGLIVSNDPRIGEAWHRGPIVLSWNDVVQPLPGRNVVVHELAHHLDGLDGDVSGNPVLANRAAQERWEIVASAGYRQLKAELAAGYRPLLDPYAATSRAEFFAVACEMFFEAPRALQGQLPELFECLAGFFHCDPASWQPDGRLVR
jgi:Mlc titration factor MtfA (ptsG expression regulator)